MWCHPPPGIPSVQRAWGSSLSDQAPRSGACSWARAETGGCDWRPLPRKRSGTTTNCCSQSSSFASFACTTITQSFCHGLVTKTYFMHLLSSVKLSSQMPQLLIETQAGPYPEGEAWSCSPPTSTASCLPAVSVLRLETDNTWPYCQTSRRGELCQLHTAKAKQPFPGWIQTVPRFFR